ncbi:hypothetical protein BD309DRAFT_953663 [Dichomitus squalens]|nr:hypothetical protein BD309DRAFT_953663 [Dichomitus squalens]
MFCGVSMRRFLVSHARGVSQGRRSSLTAEGKAKPIGSNPEHHLEPCSRSESARMRDVRACDANARICYHLRASDCCHHVHAYPHRRSSPPLGLWSRQLGATRLAGVINVTHRRFSPIRIVLRGACAEIALVVNRSRGSLCSLSPPLNRRRTVRLWQIASTEKCSSSRVLLVRGLRFLRRTSPSLFASVIAPSGYAGMQW